MNKFLNSTQQFFVKAGLCLLFSLVSLKAFEFREPLLLERGPLRMLAEEEDCGFGLRYWSSGFLRDANKAFSPNHGTKTQDIAALMFNGGVVGKGESPYENGFEFRTTQMFENYFVSEKTSGYNPLLRTAKMRLSCRYREWGGVMGTVWDMPVVKKVGRIGMRASVPMRKITVSKVDMEGVRQGAELQDVLSIQDSVGHTAIDNDPTQLLGNNRIILIRADFAEALVQSNHLNSAFILNSGNPANPVVACATVVNFPSTITPLTTTSTASDKSDMTSKVAIVYSPEGIVPRFDGDRIACVKTSQIDNSVKKTVQEISKLKANEFAVFVSGQSYADLAEDGNKGLAARKQMQELKANLWLVPIVDSVTGKSAVTGQSGALQTLNVRSQQVTENVYEWFHDHKVDFETYTKEGFGDVDCVFFYNHIFNKALNAEVFAGFKAPTGGKIKWSNNPYNVNLGSGHWEVKVGGMGSWAPTNMFGIRVEGYYSYVTSEVEERRATFKNATVKLGPPVQADVKWDYAVANIDLNMAHFSAKDITGMVGYQIYYKRKDSVKFKDATAQTWLEKTYNATSGVWSTHKATLDPLLAEANTDSIAHRMRFEASFIMTDWLEFFAGGAWTFAGRNTLRSLDAHLGFNIAF